MSFLLRTFSNTIQNKNEHDDNNNNNNNNRRRQQQQQAMNRLLSLLPTSSKSLVQYFECSGLRSLTGSGWLTQLRERAPLLVSLNFCGCAALDPLLFNDFLLHLSTPANLRHLNLQGCVRIGPSTVEILGTQGFPLKSLWLGGCSQAIGNRVVRILLGKLKGLRHLGLQTLKHITDKPLSFLSLLPSSLQSLDLSACEQLRLGGAEALQVSRIGLGLDNRGLLALDWTQEPTSRLRPQRLVLDTIGTPRRGLTPGVLAYFGLGRCLQEVHIAGCEQVRDWEIRVLAMTCGETLSCFQARATCIGNPAMSALAEYCKVLTECDVSACFRVDSQGIGALCRSRSLQGFSVTGNIINHNSSSSSSHKRRGISPSLRVLRVACLPNLTNEGIVAMANLQSLHVLDVHECPRVSLTTLCKTIVQLPKLIDVNAKGIAGEDFVSLPALLRKQMALPQDLSYVRDRALLSGLRFVNDRIFSSSSCQGCCSVRLGSQRLKASVPMRVMLHCIDCQLLPSFDKGMCATCASTCHKGHRTFVGSWARFYCDCPFSTTNGSCQVIFPFDDS